MVVHPWQPLELCAFPPSLSLSISLTLLTPLTLSLSSPPFHSYVLFLDSEGMSSLAPYRLTLIILLSSILCISMSQDAPSGTELCHVERVEVFAANPVQRYLTIQAFNEDSSNTSESFGGLTLSAVNITRICTALEEILESEGWYIQKNTRLCRFLIMKRKKALTCFQKHGGSAFGTRAARSSLALSLLPHFTRFASTLYSLHLIIKHIFLFPKHIVLMSNFNKYNSFKAAIKII